MPLKSPHGLYLYILGIKKRKTKDKAGGVSNKEWGRVEEGSLEKTGHW